MSKKLPYMSNPDMITDILYKIKDINVPRTFNADFLTAVLGFKGGDTITFISWAKKCGLLKPDGSPTDLYKKFRNPSTSGAAIAQALKIGYEELFKRNEYANKLSEKEIKKHVIEITGSAPTAKTIDYICLSFKHAKDLADFNASLDEQKTESYTTDSGCKGIYDTGSLPISLSDTDGNKKPGTNYTINIVLPETENPKVYAAIFKELKNNLLG